MQIVVAICQIHGDELRLEHLVDDEDHGYMSGFCFKCAKHYRLCSKNRYMDGCLKRQGHDGDHQDSGNHTWSGEFQKSFQS